VLKGGAVYNNGGTLKIKNTCFKNNSSAFGSAVESEGSARVDILNSSFFNNTSNCGTIYNNGGKMNIVSSTCTDNTINTYSCSTITSNGETTVLNCIVIGNCYSIDLTGKINVYGSYIGTTDTLVKTDELSTIDEKESIFRVDTDGNTQWFSVSIDSGCETLHYIPQLKSEAKNGFKVSVERGKLVYFDNEENKYITDIDAVFDEIDYTVDEMGNDRAYYYGSFAVEPQPLYGDINGDEETDIQDATLLQQYLNNEEYLTDEQLNNADINYDGEVDIKDVTDLQRYIARDYYY
ncbi:MAG: dockerin type I repeat-containing protein, partial [Ruminococcus sp.]